MKSAKRKLVTLSLLAGGTAIAIHALNKVIATSAIVKNILNSDDDDYYKWRYGNIYYTKQGSGSPILLIHDLTPSSSAYEWSKMIDELAKTHTVYALDLLGCGRSDKPSITYANYLYVQLITDFAKQVIQEPVDVIATGLSSSFVITACNQGSEYFKKIMLINPEDLAILNQIPGKRSKLLKGLLELPLIGTLLYHIIASKTNIELQFTEEWLYNPFHTNHFDLDAYYESAHRGKGNAKYLLSSIVGNYAYINIAHALKSLDNSIFIVGGEGEGGIQETIAMYTSLNTSVESVILPKAKHLPQIEIPNEVLSQINIFM